MISEGREVSATRTHEHGGDAGSTADHTDRAGVVRRVDHLSLGALDVDEVAHLELAKVLRDVSSRVALRVIEGKTASAPVSYRARLHVD